MQKESYLKGPCEKCSAPIEFPAAGLGQSIACPHCGEETTLSQPNPPEVNASEFPPVSHSKKQRTVGVMVVGFLGLIVLIGFATMAARKNHPASTSEKTIPSTKVQSANVEGAVLETSESAVAKKQSSHRAKKTASENPEFESNGLQAVRVAVEKTKNSRLIYATGVIRNQSGRQRFGVKVDLDLFDPSGAKLGSATDYVQIIEPHKEWKFRALVTDSKAARAKIISISEE